MGDQDVFDFDPWFIRGFKSISLFRPNLPGFGAHIFSVAFPIAPLCLPLGTGLQLPLQCLCACVCMCV